MALEEIPKIFFMGVHINQISENELIKLIVKNAERSKKSTINNVNVWALDIASKNKKFYKAIDSSDILFCDGYGVKLGVDILCSHKIDRLTPPDWIDKLFKACCEKNLSIYFLGDEKHILKKFNEKVLENHPRLKITGSHPGFFNTDGFENKGILEELNSSKSDIVLVGMGMPRQEIWCHTNLNSLDKGVLIPVGALFRWYSEEEKRPPKWMCNNGLEWLGRFIQHPIRYWNRYFLANISYIIRLSYLLFFKRIFDFALALSILIIFSPFFLTIFFLIKVDSNGPGFFTQMRIGKGGREFKIYKFRTLSSNYPNYVKKTGDENKGLTRFQQFLRITGFDEIPQILNVLRDDMSFVGPRPEMPFIVQKYTKFEQKRLEVKPGITGLWQLRKIQDLIPHRQIHEDIKLDIEYLHKQNPILDIKIIILTILSMIKKIYKQE